MITTGNTASPPLSKSGKIPIIATGNLRSSNVIVQNALDAGDPYIQRLKAAVPKSVQEQTIEQYRTMDPNLRPGFVELIETVRHAIRASGKNGQQAGFNATIDDAFRNFAEHVKQEVELENRFKVLDEKIGDAERHIFDITGKSGSSKSEMESLRNDLLTLKQQVADEKEAADKGKNYIQVELAKIRDSSREEIEHQYSEFLAAHKGECDRLENDLKSLKARFLIGALSKRCNDKLTEEKKSMRWKSAFFYLSLIAIGVLGYTTIRMSIASADPNRVKEIGVRAYLLNIPKTAVCFLPFYLPLIWFACHMNRLMNQARRLMEEYAHKVVVAETYSGISEQVEVLAKKGVESAKELSGNLLLSTISVICSNPNNALDKAKIVTPLSEVVDGASRLIESVGKVKQNS